MSQSDPERMTPSERALIELRPAGRLDRDLLLFEAGRQSVLRARRRSLRCWQGVAVAASVLSAALASPGWRGDAPPSGPATAAHQTLALPAAEDARPSSPESRWPEAAERVLAQGGTTARQPLASYLHARNLALEQGIEALAAAPPSSANPSMPATRLEMLSTLLNDPKTSL